MLLDVVGGNTLLFPVAFLTLRSCLEVLKTQQAAFCRNFLCCVMANEGVQMHMNKSCLWSGAVIRWVSSTIRDAGTGQEEVLEKSRTRWDQGWEISQLKGFLQSQQCNLQCPERPATSWLLRISTFGTVPLPATWNRGNKLHPPGEGQGQACCQVLNVCPMDCDGSRMV